MQPIAVPVDDGNGANELFIHQCLRAMSSRFNLFVVVEGKLLWLL